MDIRSFPRLTAAWCKSIPCSSRRRRFHEARDRLAVDAIRAGCRLATAADPRDALPGNGMAFKPCRRPGSEARSRRPAPPESRAGCDKGFSAVEQAAQATKANGKRLRHRRRQGLKGGV